MTRDQERSLWLSRAVAEKLAAHPEASLEKARENLRTLQALHTRGPVAKSLRDWRRLIDGDLDTLIDRLISDSDEAQQLRQNSPFAGILTPAERTAALTEFRASERASLS